MMTSIRCCLKRRDEILKIFLKYDMIQKHIHISSVSCLSDKLEIKNDVQVHGNRKFYELPKAIKENIQNSFHIVRKNDSEKLMKYIEENVIGKDYKFKSPFGVKRVIYCDFTASGRSLKFIEDFIQTEVLPTYGNTHTTISVTSLKTTLFRHESRDIIRSSVNASEHDAIIFTGSGCTAAIHKMIHALNLQKPPIVFLSPYEHHSSLLPWRELKSKIIVIKECEDGTIDLNDLEFRLKQFHNKGETLIGCFPVASNITGMLVDENSVTVLLHKYGALAFWDYATAAPYVEINMNPFIPGSDQALAYKDAIFISPHKFIGGVGTPGILVAKKNLFKNPVPSQGGGGTVFFVTRKNHRYLKEIEMREEGGTPAIVESIRAGLVFKLKDTLTADSIMQKEKEHLQKVLSRWKDIPELYILGSITAPRLSIFSFMIRHEPSNLFLHHNYVCALLNDLFGIQTRGGCACSGPYAQELLGIDQELANKYEHLLMEDSRLDRIHLRRYHEYSSNEILRPGFTRLNIPFFIKDEEVDFIIDAVEILAKDGWKLLPQYIFNPETGEWKHKSDKVFKDRKWLSSISYSSGRMVYDQTLPNIHSSENFQECLEKAKDILEHSFQITSKTDLDDQAMMFSEEANYLRWFLLPSEAQMHSSRQFTRKKDIPFTPKQYSWYKNTESKIDNSSPQTTNKEIKMSLFEHESANLKYNEKNLATLALSHNNGSHASTDIKPDCLVNDNQQPKLKWHHPPKYLSKPMVQAIKSYNMIHPGDRILICLSGGKDSLSLLHALHWYQNSTSKKGFHFSIGAMTVDPQSSSYDPHSLKQYLQSLNVPYYYEEQGIMQHASSLPELKSICSFCSRMKRGRIYSCARREGYNVIALGHHLDDLVETFIMNAFHNGILQTMKAHYTVKEGDLRVIRPFVYVREKYTRKFAEHYKLPVIAENCPACFENPKERHRTKQFLAQQELMFPLLFCHLRSTLRPLMAVNKCGISIQSIFLQTLNNDQEMNENEES